MEVHQLRCFLAVIKEGGFNRATSQLHISQPALSYQIKRLEQELGASLFHRRPGGVNPTEAGRVLSQYAQRVLETVKQAQSAVEELVEGVVGEIRIGTTNSMGIYFLPQMLWNMREKYPTARPTVVYRDSEEVVDLLKANKLDLALVANPPPDRRLRQEIIFEEEISLVCGKSHPFYKRTSVTAAELEGLQFIALSPKCPTGRLIQDFLDQQGVHVEPAISTENVETVKKMVEIGLGVAFLPDMVTYADVACGADSLRRFARIKIGPPLFRRIAIVTWKNIEISRATEAFIQELRQHAMEWKGSGRLEKVHDDISECVLPTGAVQGRIGHLKS